MTKCRQDKQQGRAGHKRKTKFASLAAFGHIATVLNWSNHRLAGTRKQWRGGSSWDGYFMYHKTYNERLSLTLMTTKLKYTETWSIACFHATYLILLLSCWWGSHTDCRDWCHKNERTVRMGLDGNPQPLTNLARICRMFGFIFHKRVVNKVVTDDSPGRAAAVIGCLTESSDMFGQVNSQSNLEL